MPSKRLEEQRLRAIEMVAVDDRHLAAERLDSLGVMLSWDTDLVLVAAVLTNGDVRAWPNLRDSMGRVAGHLDWWDGCLRLRFEAFHPVVRQRFSIAHELGHLALHVERDNSGQLIRLRHRCAPPPVTADAVEVEEINTDDDPLEEREADAYAGAFLMPAPEFAADTRRLGRSSGYLAMRYGVSPAAARYRLRVLDRLGLIAP